MKVRKLSSIKSGNFKFSLGKLLLPKNLYAAKCLISKVSLHKCCFKKPAFNLSSDQLPMSTPGAYLCSILQLGTPNLEKSTRSVICRCIISSLNEKDINLIKPSKKIIHTYINMCVCVCIHVHPKY